MKIAMTGASGRLGSAVYKELASDFEVVKLGRNSGETPWCLGEIPTIESMNGVSALFHFAWSLHDRKKDSDLNERAVERLADFSSKLNIPFVFISTSAASSKSEYGLSKRAAEHIVSSFSGTNLRIGIVPGANRAVRIGQRSKPQFVPVFGVGIHLTCLQELVNWMKIFVVKSSNLYEQQNVVLISDYVDVEDLYSSDYLFRLHIPERILFNTSKFLSYFSRRFRNLCDSVAAIRTTPKLVFFEDLD
jgi:nucleoside-diphosphate-sugar epimerase